MSLDPKQIVQKKFEEALQGKKEKDDKADAVIWTSILINGGLGAVPFGINVWTFVGVNTVMVGFLGSIYGYHLDDEGKGKIIRQIFTSVSATFLMFTLGMKFFAEVLKGAGVITMGGATVAGMALDAALSGAVTYALGYTTKEFFKKGQKLSKEEIDQKFQAFYKEGKSKVKRQKENN